MNWPPKNRTSRLLLTMAIVAVWSNFAFAQYDGAQYDGAQYQRPPSDRYPLYDQNPQTQPQAQPPAATRYPSTDNRGQFQGDSQTHETQPQAYNQPYTRRYPTTDSLGPYDDFRQQDDFRPDFQQPTRSADPQREVFEPGKLIGIVGEQPILAGDLLGDINQMLAPYKDKATQEQLDEQRQLLLKKLLPQTIQTKMLYQEMLANVPPEAIPSIQDKLANEFDEKQLADLMERAKVNSPAELDAELRSYGTSIDKQRRQFAEQILAREVVRQNVDTEPSVSHQEMVQYYQKHAGEYERPARVRWEELSVRFDKFNSKAEAYRAIANMGNRVLRGAAFSRVAREESQGFTADNGGWHDWTLTDSLKAKEIEEAIFTLPLEQLSRIIESDLGFHVIRVLDREEAGRTPFFQEQVRIKSKLQKEKRDVQVEAYLAKVKARTRVWTIYDDGEQP